MEKEISNIISGRDSDRHFNSTNCELHLIVEDFPSLKIPNLHAPFPNFKTCLVVKIDDIWVSTTKIGLESGFEKVRFENPTPREVLQ
jgi:hypothetical protein